MVKSMKIAMKAIIRRADLHEEEFRTTASKMAYLINSRQIQVFSDFNSYDVLTPKVNDKVKKKLSMRLWHQIKIRQHVWKIFQEEVIPMLRPREKWCKETDQSIARE